MANDPQSLGEGLIDNVKTGLFDAVSDTGIGSALRSLNLLPGAEPASSAFVAASWDDDEERKDWRVKLSLPETGSFKLADRYLPMYPLRDTGGLVFPYTPNVYITYSANYDNLHPTHSNYPFPIYQNSAVDQFVITGEFTVENAEEGAYWIAANHYLRSITKMEYGERSANTGAPPPVVKLNGYGDFVFNDVPVVVQQYTVELGDAVDYIKTDVGPNGSWAPTRSTISVTLQPAYSRDSVNQFSLQKFVRGDYIYGDGQFI